MEPNLANFDSNERKLSPLSKKAVNNCGNNPTFSCSVSDSYSCISTNTWRSLVNPENKVNLGDVPLPYDFCPTGSTCNDPLVIEPHNPNDVVEDACAASNCKDSAIFLNLQEVRTSTTSNSACIAMYGPDLRTDATSGNQVNTCGYLFQDHTTDTLLGKWTDLDCNQKTYSLICDLSKLYCRPGRI